MSYPLRTKALMVLVLGHLAEHLAQAVQLGLLGWPRTEARGLLGYWWPVLARTESLHYAYALLMLVGLMACYRGFDGQALTLWTWALGIQVWHHFEHLSLLGQYLTGTYLLSATKPTSFLELVPGVQRIELHLFYNLLVLVPMVAAMVAQHRERREAVPA